MNAERWRQIEAVLDAALDADPPRWPAVLRERCVDDPQLRTEVERLLRHLGSARGFLASPPAAAAASLVAETRATMGSVGQRIGAYRVLRQIGEGGSAWVYLAERDDGQFRQRVALKLLRPGHDAEVEQDRFRAERQILASLNHPNIARLLDGGITDAGMPYLVMELVEGEPMDAWCASRGLTVHDRLRLFLTVCEATRYAHRNLVVHRDLKPSNILVTADGQVKLLDFGLAKLLDGRAADSSLATVTSRQWMTPAYAAPEQVRGETSTTLTDVYQLGVILFEMLAGVLPFGRRDGSYDLARAILEQDPPVPSSVGRRDRGVRGDLDAIVLMALRKEPEHRYASVDALRDDIERSLAGRPVLARGGGAIYRVSRFVRRHRLSVAAAATFVALLGAYAVTLTLHARRVRATLARVEQEKAKAQSTAGFLIGLFNPYVSGFGPGDSVTAHQLLVIGETEAAELSGQPLAQAQLLTVLGTIHHNMRSYGRADSLLRRALELRRARLGPAHVDVAESMFQLGQTMRGRGDWQQARALLSAALATQRRALGEAHPATVETALRLSLLFNRIDEVIEWDRRALAISRRVHGPEHPVVAESMLRLAMSLRSRGTHEEAERLLRASLAMRQRLAPGDHRNIARHTMQLAILLKHRGRFAESEALHRAYLAAEEARYGRDHPRLSGALRTLADVLAEQGKLRDAERLYRRDLASRERAFGTRHVDYALSLAYLGDVLRRQSRLVEAESLLRRELEIWRSAYGPDHAAVAGSLHGLANVLLDKRELDEAERLLVEAKAIRDRQRGPGSPAAALLLPSFARLARERGHFQVADSLLAEAATVLRSAGYTDLQETMQRIHREHADLNDAWGRWERAEQHRARLIARR